MCFGGREITAFAFSYFILVVTHPDSILSLSTYGASVCGTVFTTFPCFSTASLLSNSLPPPPSSPVIPARRPRVQALVYYRATSHCSVDFCTLWSLHLVTTGYHLHAKERTARKASIVGTSAPILDEDKNALLKHITFLPVSLLHAYVQTLCTV